MASRVLCIGDPHFQPANAAASAVMAAAIIGIIRDRASELDAVVVLGDLLHRHDRIDLGSMAAATSFLRGVRTALPADRPLWVLIGNHDRPNNTVTCVADDHAFGALSLWENTVVVDEVKECEIRRTGHRFVLVPYVPPGVFARQVSAAAANVQGAAGVFAHQEFTGAPLGAVRSAAEDYPSGWPACVSGHIHERVSIGDRVHYMGTPMQHGWSGDSGSVSIVVFAGDGRADVAETIRIAGTGRNATVTFGSAAEFRAFIAGALAAGSVRSALVTRAGGGAIRGIRVKIAAGPADFAAAENSSEGLAAAAAGVSLSASPVAAAADAPVERAPRIASSRAPFASRIADAITAKRPRVAVVNFLDKVFPLAAPVWSAAAHSEDT